MDSYLFPQQSRPDSSRPSCTGGRAQANVSEATDSQRSVVFPKQKSQSIIATTRSNSIPFPKKRVTKQAVASEIMRAEDEFLADVRDSAMFTRIVSGMAKNASFLQDPKCRQDVVLSLTHIVATRYLSNDELDERVSTDWAYPCNAGRMMHHKGGSHLPVLCACALERLGKDALIHHQDDDLSLDEMIFEMDL